MVLKTITKGLFFQVLGNPASWIVFGLLITWGMTAAYSWWAKIEENERLASVAETYMDAYSDAQDQLDENDRLTLKVDRRKKVIHAKNDEAIEGLYNIRENAVGTPAQQHLRDTVPQPVIDSLRVAMESNGFRDEHKRKETATKRALRRLQEAFGKERVKDP